MNDIERSRLCGTSTPPLLQNIARHGPDVLRDDGAGHFDKESIDNRQMLYLC